MPPTELSYFELLNDVMQEEPATAFSADIMGSLAAISIVKGKPFAPDAHIKKMLTNAASIVNVAVRPLNFRFRPSEGGYY
ncbi:hypothetical protein [Pseudomonas koreensis]|uniref:hypothetical protein n=1 Tax=Pseudomonas koreensis TaxID=198620 RepID=UPI00320BA253